MTGLITDIKRYALHDGPGVGVSVFFKGCPLHCLWCCNPETQKPYEELYYYVERCIGCLRCVEACPYGAISPTEVGKINIDRSRCRAQCFPHPPCVNSCYTGALQVCGERVELEALIKLIERDAAICRRSGGGVTVTGGEPTLQHEFVIELLKQCHEMRLNTAIETCGYTDWHVLDAITDHTDLIFYDIKLYDSALHLEYTGKANERILNNARLLSEKAVRLGIKMVIRMVIVPGFTDTAENVLAIGRFVASELKTNDIELLPYHRLGLGKYELLGREYKLRAVKPPTREKMRSLYDLLEDQVLNLVRF